MDLYSRTCNYQPCSRSSCRFRSPSIIITIISSTPYPRSPILYPCIWAKNPSLNSHLHPHPRLSPAPFTDHAYHRTSPNLTPSPHHLHPSIHPITRPRIIIRYHLPRTMQSSPASPYQHYTTRAPRATQRAPSILRILLTSALSPTAYPPSTHPTMHNPNAQCTPTNPDSIYEARYCDYNSRPGR